MAITRPKRYAEKCHIRESAQTPSAEPLNVLIYLNNLNES